MNDALLWIAATACVALVVAVGFLVAFQRRLLRLLMRELERARNRHVDPRFRGTLIHVPTGGMWITHTTSRADDDDTDAATPAIEDDDPDDDAR